jgi:hypothetical protein
MLQCFYKHALRWANEFNNLLPEQDIKDALANHKQSILQASWDIFICEKTSQQGYLSPSHH